MSLFLPTGAARGLSKEVLLSTSVGRPRRACRESALRLLENLGEVFDNTEGSEVSEVWDGHDPELEDDEPGLTDAELMARSQTAAARRALERQIRVFGVIQERVNSSTAAAEDALDCSESGPRAPLLATAELLGQQISRREDRLANVARNRQRLQLEASDAEERLKKQLQDTEKKCLVRQERRIKEQQMRVIEEHTKRCAQLKVRRDLHNERERVGEAILRQERPRLKAPGPGRSTARRVERPGPSARGERRVGSAPQAARPAPLTGLALPQVGGSGGGPASVTPRWVEAAAGPQCKVGPLSAPQSKVIPDGRHPGQSSGDVSISVGDDSRSVTSEQKGGKDRGPEKDVIQMMRRSHAAFHCAYEAWCKQVEAQDVHWETLWDDMRRGGTDPKQAGSSRNTTRSSSSSSKRKKVSAVLHATTAVAAMQAGARASRLRQERSAPGSLVQSADSPIRAQTAPTGATSRTRSATGLATSAAAGMNVGRASNRFVGMPSHATTGWEAARSGSAGGVATRSQREMPAAKAEPEEDLFPPAPAGSELFL